MSHQPPLSNDLAHRANQLIIDLGIFALAALGGGSAGVLIFDVYPRVYWGLFGRSYLDGAELGVVLQGLVYAIIGFPIVMAATTVGLLLRRTRLATAIIIFTVAAVAGLRLVLLYRF